MLLGIEMKHHGYKCAPATPHPHPAVSWPGSYLFSGSLHSAPCKPAPPQPPPSALFSTDFLDFPSGHSSQSFSVYFRNYLIFLSVTYYL